MTIACLMSASGLTTGPRADILVVTGDLDLEGSLEVAEAVRQAVRVGRVELTIELSAVRFIDAAGVGMLMATRRRLRRAGGHLLLSGAGPEVTRVLDLTGVQDAFAVA